MFSSSSSSSWSGWMKWGNKDEKKGEKKREKKGGKDLEEDSSISTTELERKIEDAKRELEKLEEIRQMKEIQEKLDRMAMEEREEIKEEPVIWNYIPKATYRHIVFSGGAAGGLYIYGALKTAHERGL
jgi:TolA-binding protein